MWSITIDQRTSAGSSQRHGPYEIQYLIGGDDMVLLCHAIEEAIENAGLLHVTEGQYQITVTSS